MGTSAHPEQVLARPPPTLCQQPLSPSFPSQSGARVQAPAARRGRGRGLTQCNRLPTIGRHGAGCSLHFNPAMIPEQRNHVATIENIPAEAINASPPLLQRIRKVFTRELLVSLALGQVLSLLICGIGLTSKYLVEDFHANTPVFQSFLNYILLFLVYTTTLAVRQGEENLLAILKRRWWKYMILGVIDIEANYLVIKAYQYTTLTSVQLLDCFVIPVVLLLSWFFLLVRYKALHFIGVGVCLLGMGCMVGADVLVGRHQGAGDNKLLGDLLVLAGATLYGISNVCEEFIVKNLSRVEFLGMIGLFGSFFSGIQLAIIEHKELLKVPWDWQIGLLYVGFSACMFGLYSFMPVVIKRSSATAVNLSLLTADIYSLFCGLFLFHYKFSGLYLLSFFTIILGLILYSSTSTYVAQDPRVYKQFRNQAGPAVEIPTTGQLEPSVTYSSLGQETEEEAHVRVP
ncbi:solute carrier family 35 member F2 [Pristis pectinata]|uniref:solute carrier family 35 member F2 n=1 Tax=Pristis pectinata TaxID=685728 RepID=UPI00223E59C5|nr:solute carrier family 35 member F2 [Pristis pectinata]